MDRHAGFDHAPPKNLAQTLVSKANAKYWDMAGKATNGGKRYSGLMRCTWAGGDYEVARIQGGYLVTGDAPVPEHADIRA